MNSIISFLAYANAQNRILTNLNGIIMYPSSQCAIPEYVYFLPVTLPKQVSLTKFFKSQFIYLPEKFYILYFNPISYILPDLYETIRSLTFIHVQYGMNRIDFLMSYGNITFDTTDDNDLENEDESLILSVPLFVNNTNFYINVTELPYRMGKPKLFEKVEFVV